MKFGEAPENVQKTEVKHYLGTKLRDAVVESLKLELRMDKLRTLNDFQKLLGDINWIWPYCNLPNAELCPLFDILKGDSNLQSPRQLTPLARAFLQKVEQSLAKAQVDRVDPTLPISFCVIATDLSSTGVFWQKGPLCWVYLHHSPAKVLPWYPESVAQLILKGIKVGLGAFGKQPDVIIMPYTPKQIEVLASTNNDWAILCTSMTGRFENHPTSPWLQFVMRNPMIYPRITQTEPIPGAVNVFTDGSKGGVGVVYVEGNQPQAHVFPYQSAQAVELCAVLQVFQEVEEAFNLVSDIQYVVQAVQQLETLGVIKAASTVCTLLSSLQKKKE